MGSQARKIEKIEIFGVFFDILHLKMWGYAGNARKVHTVFKG